MNDFQSTGYSDEDMRMMTRSLSFLLEHKILRSQPLDNIQLKEREEELTDWCVDASERIDSPYRLLSVLLKNMGYNLVKLSNRRNGTLSRNFEIAGTQGLAPGNHAFTILRDGNLYCPDWATNSYMYDQLFQKKGFIGASKADICFWFSVIFISMLKLFYARNGHSLEQYDDYQKHEFLEEDIVNLISETISSCMERPKEEMNIVHQYFHDRVRNANVDSGSGKASLKEIYKDIFGVSDKVATVLNKLKDIGYVTYRTIKDKNTGAEKKICRQTLFSALEIANNADVIMRLMPIENSPETSEGESISYALDDIYENDMPAKGKRWEEM